VARQPSSALIGAFVVGAVLLAVAAAVLLNGDRFFSRRTTHVAYFDGSLDGLDVGAPVTFNGVRIGSVTDVRVVIEPDATSVRTPVLFDIDEHRLHAAKGGTVASGDPANRLDALIQHGLRARLEIQSLVTGQRAVALNFYPGTPARIVGATRHQEIPTIPSRIDTLTRTLQSLPLDTLVAETIRTMQSIEALASAPEVKSALGKLERVLGKVDGLVQKVNGRVDPLATSVEQAAVAARSTLTEAQAALAQLGPAASAAIADYQALAQDARKGVGHADAEIGSVAAAVRTTLADADIGSLAAALRTTLTDAQDVLADARAVIGNDSPVREDVTNALQEITKAARSMRTLADYLDRHPEAVVVGKRREARP
jgi:phospholipid/cholesterol/gamma-HCH transport system substrate-binding protein